MSSQRRKSPHWSGTMVAAFLSMGGLALSFSRPVHCQFGGCVNSPSDVTNPPSLNPLLTTPESCTVDGLTSDNVLTNGAWIRVGKEVRSGASASTTGQCNLRGWNPYPTNCQSYGTELRKIQYVVIYEVNPNGTHSPSWPYYQLTNQAGGVTVYLQSIDSSVAGSTNGPFPFLLSVEGAHDFRHRVVTTATACNITPTTTHPETHRQVNLLTCQPAWFFQQDQYGEWIPGGYNYHAPSGEITINVPPGFGDALDAVQAAAEAYETLLGRVINVNSNATCTGGSGSCVTLGDDHGSLPGDSGCASLGTSSPDASGAWTDTMTIRLESSWVNAHGDRLQHNIAHELGHYFGLWNRLHASCTNGTIMGASPPPVNPNGPLCNDSSAPASGTITLPTAADALPLLLSTYGNGNRKICGW